MPLLPFDDSPELLKDIRAMDVVDRVEWMMMQVAAPEGAPPPVTHIPRGNADRLRLPILTPHQLKLGRHVMDPVGPSVIGVMGGIGVGKTAGGAMAATMVAVSRPGSHSLIVGHTQTNLSMNVRPFLELFLSGPADAEPYFKWDSQARCYRLNNGSVIWIRHYRIPHGWDEARNPIEGGNINGLLFVEEAEQIHPWIISHALQRSRGTSVGYDGRTYGPTIILNGRPGQNRWWMPATRRVGRKLAAIALRDGARVRGVVEIVSKTAENPYNGPDYLRNLEADKSPAEFLSLTQCLPMPAPGAHYSAFLASVAVEGEERLYWPHTNLVRSSDFGGPGDVIVSLDFGINSPAAVFYRAVPVKLPTTGKAHILMVIVGSMAPMNKIEIRGRMVDHITTPVFIDLIRQRCEDEGWIITDVNGDPAGIGRDKHTGYSDFDLIARHPDADFDDQGGGLGLEVNEIQGAVRRSIPRGVQRVQVLICNAVGTRTLVCTDEYWDWCAAQEDDDTIEGQPRTWAYTVRAYTHQISQKKRRGSGDHASTHMADAVRYGVAVDFWENPRIVHDTSAVNDHDAALDAEVEHWVTSR